MHRHIAQGHGDVRGDHAATADAAEEEHRCGDPGRDVEGCEAEQQRGAAQADDHSREATHGEHAPDPVHQPPGARGPAGRAEGEGGHGEAGPERGEAQAVLVEEREDQPDAAEADEVERADAGTDGVAAHGGEQARIEQRLGTAGHEAALPSGEGDDERGTGEEQPPQPAEAAGARLDQRKHEREDAEAEEQDPGHIQVSPAGPAGARQQAAAEQDGQDADGDVDVEDPPPALGAVGQGEDQAADERADGGGDTDGGAEEPEGAAAFGAAEHLLDERGVLGRHETGCQSLGEPGRHQQRDAGGRPAGRAEDSVSYTHL